MKTNLVWILVFQTLLGIAQTPILIIPKGHTEGVTSSCFSEQGNYILTGSKDFTAKLWDRAGKEIQTYRLNNEIQSVAISPDEKMVLIGSTDGKVTLFKLTGEVIKILSDH
ncbi:MAG: hypothetical protein ABIO44_01335, partial [Saprospiraceae bacterium]